MPSGAPLKLSAVDVVRASWTSASFLAYTGALTVLASAVWLDSTLSDQYSDAAFAGWAALVLLGAAVCAAAFRSRGRELLAGLFAFVSVALFAVFIAALEAWFGWLTHDSPLHGFHWGLLLLELLTLVAALWALRVFHHPLLVLAAAGVGWYFVADLLSSGGNWSAWVSLLYGLTLLPFAVATNRVYGFWLHVVSGLTIGGALLYWWHSSDWNFILLGLAGLLYLLFARATKRSSWAVLGAFGLFLTAAHFIDQWFGPIITFSLFGEGSQAKHDWAVPLGFAVLGFVYVALGMMLWRRESSTPPPAAAP
jgi:hypothetical protein